MKKQKGELGKRDCEVEVRGFGTSTTVVRWGGARALPALGYENGAFGRVAPRGLREWRDTHGTVYIRDRDLTTMALTVDASSAAAFNTSSSPHSSTPHQPAVVAVQTRKVSRPTLLPHRMELASTGQPGRRPSGRAGRGRGRGERRCLRGLGQRLRRTGLIISVDSTFSSFASNSDFGVGGALTLEAWASLYRVPSLSRYVSCTFGRY